MKIYEVITTDGVNQHLLHSTNSYDNGSESLHSALSLFAKEVNQLRTEYTPVGTLGYSLTDSEGQRCVYTLLMECDGEDVREIERSEYFV